MDQWLGGGGSKEVQEKEIKPDTERDPAKIGITVDPRFKGETQTFNAYDKTDG